MAQHPANDGLPVAAERTGLDFDPLRVSRWHVVAEAANLLLLLRPKPAFPIFRGMAVDKRAVLVWHGAESGEHPDQTG